MKTRKGFVSNSSSSSFVLFGCEIPEDFINKLVKEYIIKENKEEYGDDIPTETTDDYGSLVDYIGMMKDPNYIDEMCEYEKAEICGFDRYEDGCFFGFSPFEFKENPDMTFNQLKERYTARLINMGMSPDDVEFEYIELS